MTIIDSQSGALQSITPIAPGPFGIFSHQGTNSFFFVGSTAPDGGVNSIDVSTLTVTNIGGTLGGTFLYGAASNGSDRVYIFSSTDTATNIYSVDTGTGVSTPIPVPDGKAYVGQAYDAALGRIDAFHLEVAATIRANIVSVDPATAVASLITTLPMNISTSAPEEAFQTENAAVDPTTHQYFIILSGASQDPPTSDQLLVIDTMSGQIVASPTINAPAGSLSGLAFQP